MSVINKRCKGGFRMKRLGKKKLLKTMNILEDIYNDPQGGIGGEPDIQWPPQKVRTGSKQIKYLIERFGEND